MVIYFSYNIKENNELNLDKKIQKLQTKLDIWSSQDLTIFGRAMLIKTLGLSQLIYSASNLDVPKGIVDILRTKSFKFLWKKEKDKTKRSGLYQDLDNGGLRMTDFDIILKALNSLGSRDCCGFRTIVIGVVFQNIISEVRKG